MLKGFLVPVARRSSWLNSLRVISTTETLLTLSLRAGE